MSPSAATTRWVVCPLLSLALAAAAAARQPPADLVLVNGRVTTQDKARPTASAVAIKDGKFVAVGNDEDA